MRIAVEATCWHNTRGYGRHARALLRALIRRDSGNQYVLFFDSAEGLDDVPENAEVHIVAARSQAAVAASANGRRSLGDMWRMSRALCSAAPDVVLFPTVYSYVPVPTTPRKIVMIHDVIAETYPHLTLPRASARWFWRVKVALGRMQADAIVTVSEYSRRGIIRHFGTSPDRVFVAGEAGDPAFRILGSPEWTPALRAAGLAAGKRMIVYVGGFGPHKNLDALVDAFAGLASREAFGDVQLVMVGEYRKEVFHSEYAALAERIRTAGLTGRVIFTGYLADEDLVHLLNLSAVLVLPSLMEGFGLPAVEAAACGCPVIATTESPLPELLGAGGIFIDPRGQALRGALERVLSSEELRRTMGQAGAEAAARLTWEAAAARMQEVIERMKAV